MKLFVLSDVHSFYEPMMAALEKNGFDINNKDHHVVVCGDLFDRGPDANKVFAFAKRMSDEDRLTYICGNHEELLFDCVQEIKNGRYMGGHHTSNGTLDTIIQVTGCNIYDLYSGTYAAEELNRVNSLLAFIANNAVDYAEVGDYIFVHGWIPCNQYTGKFEENWRDGDWESARWINGMLAWKRGARIPGKTIVCGHYHSSWGHSNIHQDRKEYPNKSRKDWQKSFEPFVDEGIIAIDACTAYSNFCNCFVIEI